MPIPARVPAHELAETCHDILLSQPPSVAPPAPALGRARDTARHDRSGAAGDGLDAGIQRRGHERCAAGDGERAGELPNLVERVSPAVVSIATTQVMPAALQSAPRMPPGLEEFFRQFGGPFTPQGMVPEPREMHALGSGFIIDPAGYVVTNNHVIDGATKVTVILSDDSNLEATIIGRDEKTDLALLKVDAGRKLPSLAFGDSDGVRVGDWAIAVGDPFGLGGTVTAGIVSARGRDLRNGPYDDYLQLDAPINQGNSGGPALDANGQVIGINSATFRPPAATSASALQSLLTLPSR